MAEKKNKIFSQKPTYEELIDIVEELIKRVAKYEDNTTIMFNGATTMLEGLESQQAEITLLQSQLELRDVEVDILTKRIIALEEILAKKGS